MAKIIINADDFGISDKFDQAILSLIEKDFLLSTSVVVEDGIKPNKVAKLKYLAKNKKASIGLHFKYDNFSKNRDSNINDYKLIAKNLREQFNHFIELFQTKPTHLDKHNWEQTYIERKVMCDFAIYKSIPIRLHQRSDFFQVYTKKYQDKIKFTDRQYNLSSKKYGLTAIKKDINDLKKNSYICEVIAHPGFYDHRFDGTKYGTTLNENREEDYQKVIQLNTFLKKNGMETSSFLDFEKSS